MTSNIYTTPIAKRKWNNLWHCKEGWRWKQLWNHTYGDPDTTLSQYEYTICHYCWRKRLDEGEIIKVVAAWWKKHEINGNFHHLRHFTIPKTYNFVKSYLEIIEYNYLERSRTQQRQRRNRRRTEQIAGGLRGERTRDLILRTVHATGTVTAADVADGLPLSLVVTGRQLARLTAAGVLERVGRGRYRAVSK